MKGPPPPPAHRRKHWVAEAHVEYAQRLVALELGQAALASERQWHALAQTTANRSSTGEARSATPAATDSGTGSSEGAGTPAPEPVPTR